MNTFERVFAVIKHIPKGKVMSYKVVGEKAHTTARVVGFALHTNKNPKEYPCHRVVKTDGTLAVGYAFGGREQQKEILKSEGVTFLDADHIDMKRFIQM